MEHLISDASFIDLGVALAVMSVISAFSSYRVLTRTFGWGPSDT